MTALSFFDMRQLATAEDDRDDHLVLVGQEFAGPVDLDLDIVIARFGANANLLDLAVMALALVLPLFLLVLELAEVHDAADGGRSLGATSTRSNPASRATPSACSVGIMPSCSPSAEMTRTGVMRICSFTRCDLSIAKFLCQDSEM